MTPPDGCAHCDATERAVSAIIDRAVACREAAEEAESTGHQALCMEAQSQAYMEAAEMVLNDLKAVDQAPEVPVRRSS